MGSLFDPLNYPKRVPDQLVVGDRWAWKRTRVNADYPGATHSMKTVFRREIDGHEIEVASTFSGTEFLFEVAAATTATYDDGRYRWQEYVIRTADQERITLEVGSVLLLPNKDNVATDPRSHVKKVLDAIEATIEGRATKDQLSYSISTGQGSRSLSRMSIEELLLFRDRYKAEYAREIQAERIEQGLGTKGRVLVRF